MRKKDKAEVLIPIKENPERTQELIRMYQKLSRLDREKLYYVAGAVNALGNIMDLSTNSNEQNPA